MLPNSPTRCNRNTGKLDDIHAQPQRFWSSNRMLSNPWSHAPSIERRLNNRHAPMQIHISALSEVAMACSPRMLNRPLLTLASLSALVALDSKAMRISEIVATL